MFMGVGSLSYCHTSMKPKKHPMPLLFPWYRNKILEFGGGGGAGGLGVGGLGRECRVKVFDGIHKPSQLESLLYTACPPNPVNGC